MRDERGAQRWLVVLAPVSREATGERMWLSRIACFDGDSVLLATKSAIVRVTISDGALPDAELFALSGPSIPCAVNRFGAVTRGRTSAAGPDELTLDRADQGRFVWRCDEPLSEVAVATDAPVLAARFDGHHRDRARSDRVELRSFDGLSLGSVSMGADGDGIESFALSADGTALVVVSRRGGVYVLRSMSTATATARR